MRFSQRLDAPSRHRSPLSATAGGIRRRLGRLPILLALTGLVAVALTGTAGRALAAQPPSHRPASLGPPAGLPAAAIPAAAVTVCAKVAWKTGFSYTSTINTSAGAVRQVVLAVAVAMAESSCNPGAVYTNPGGCRDRGLWQIDDCYHRDVNDACAFQIQCNANAAWNISNRGTNWAPWSTYTSGVWKQYLPSARAAVTGFTIMLADQGLGTCLDASKSDVGNGGTIQQWKCVSTDPYQQWTVTASNGGNPLLRNVGAGTCLDAASSEVRNGGRIQQWTCNTATDTYQRWSIRGSGKLNTNGNAAAGLQNVGAQLCLDSSASVTGNGGRIQQWTCAAGDANQQWN
jgi:hypothetical protein